jgi:uncharacterized protein
MQYAIGWRGIDVSPRGTWWMFPIEIEAGAFRLVLMLFRVRTWIGLLLVSCSMGCDSAPPLASTDKGVQPLAERSVPTLNPLGYLNAAQPKLPTVKMFLGAKEIVAEVASKPVEIQTGMMHRTEMGENEGMLFVFGRPMRAAFYMRNTKIPLTCAYIDPEGVVLELHDMKPMDESSIEASSDQVQYVLEMRQGWFQKNGIVVGAVVTTERGKLRQTFFRP